jgi:6-pyruvoyltetrahydropterin/6-carboxytetrahydropterin synthase
MITAERYHDISFGHRVYGHESKCRHLHGHNYRIVFTINGELDSLGRVLDFGVIKSHLCDWLENHWDHKLLLWDNDPMRHLLHYGNEQSAIVGSVIPAEQDAGKVIQELHESIVLVPFNPTAENLGEYLLHVIGPQELKDTGATLICVRVEETRKCSATAALDTWGDE